MLFPDGREASPRLSDPSAQSTTLNSLASAYHMSGQPGRALTQLRIALFMADEQGDRQNISVGLCNLSYLLYITGGLRESEAAARRALVIARDQQDMFREAISLQWLGLAMAAREVLDGSQVASDRSLRLFVERRNAQGEGTVSAFIAQRALWMGDRSHARLLADRAWELAHDRRNERDFIRAARLQGEAALVLDDHKTADERLSHALARAMAVDYVEDQFPALVALAELARRQGNPEAARQLLEDVWERAELGPYPLFHADACNVLARIERDAGNNTAAVEAATRAYRLAWCDGPPFAYHWGLETAKAHLAELGAPEPDDLSQYDESQYEPMPEVEIDPQVNPR